MGIRDACMGTFPLGSKRIAGPPIAYLIRCHAPLWMLLRDSEYKGTSSAAQVLEQARAALGEDEGGYRAAFIELVERWRKLPK
ncbi:MAG: DUF3520 domain-containing protein [Gemmatimonadaceae bacterium]|nr:DUF3520 domain-containing protein [Gemmatimonadaceae bacterium]